MILALALSAKSSSSTATLIKALERGSRRPSWLKMRQKSLRGVGPCEARQGGQRTERRVERDRWTYMHLEDSADAIDGHPDEILTLGVCERREGCRRLELSSLAKEE